MYVGLQLFSMFGSTMTDDNHLDKRTTTNMGWAVVLNNAGVDM